MIMGSREPIYATLFEMLKAQLKPETALRGAPVFGQLPAAKSVLYQHETGEKPLQRRGLDPLWRLSVRIYGLWASGEPQSQPQAPRLNAFTDMVDKAMGFDNPVQSTKTFGGLVLRAWITDVKYFEMYSNGVWKGYYADIELETA